MHPLSVYFFSPGAPIPLTGPVRPMPNPVTVTVKVRPSTGEAFEVSVDPSQTVAHLKGIIEEQQLVPAGQQRLIHRGRILEDSEALSHYGLEEGHTIHMVRGQGAPSTPSPTAPLFPNPFSAFPAAPASAVGSPFGLPPPTGTGALAGLFNNPVISSIFESPDLLREIMMSNPATRQMMERNPEIAQTLQDPRNLRQMMEMARSPTLMQEMTRHTDRALSNLDVMPGGMDALSRLYHEIQVPLEEARVDSLSPTTPDAERPSAPTRPLGPLNPQPLPNPWRQQRELYAGGRGFNPFLTPGGDAFGDVYRSPAAMQLAARMMPTPDLLPSYGGLGAGLGNGELDNMGWGPENAGAGAAPDFMSLFGLSGPRGVGAPLGGAPLAASFGPPGATPEDLSAFSQLAGLFNPPPTATATPSAAPPLLPSRDQYEEQLRELEEMGFPDAEANLRALQASGGDVLGALEEILHTRL